MTHELKKISIPADVMLILEDSQNGVMTFNMDEKICSRERPTDSQWIDGPEKNKNQLEKVIKLRRNKRM